MTAICPRCGKVIPQFPVPDNAVQDICLCDPEDVPINSKEKKITWRQLIQQRKDEETRRVQPKRPKGVVR